MKKKCFQIVQCLLTMKNKKIKRNQRRNIKNQRKIRNIVAKNIKNHRKKSEKNEEEEKNNNQFRINPLIYQNGDFTDYTYEEEDVYLDYSVEEKKKRDFEYLQESQSVLTEDDIIAEEKANIVDEKYISSDWMNSDSFVDETALLSDTNLEISSDDNEYDENIAMVQEHFINQPLNKEENTNEEEEISPNQRKRGLKE